MFVERKTINLNDEKTNITNAIHVHRYFGFRTKNES